MKDSVDAAYFFDGGPAFRDTVYLFDGGPAFVAQFYFFDGGPALVTQLTSLILTSPIGQPIPYTVPLL
jgi:hypothetical protein